MPPEILRFTNLQDAIDACRRPDIERIFIIGGGQVYQDAIDLQVWDQIIMTRLLREYEVDTFFPRIAAKCEQSSIEETEGVKYTREVYRK